MGVVEFLCSSKFSVTFELRLEVFTIRLPPAPCRRQQRVSCETSSLGISQVLVGMGFSCSNVLHREEFALRVASKPSLQRNSWVCASLDHKLLKLRVNIAVLIVGEFLWRLTDHGG